MTLKELMYGQKKVHALELLDRVLGHMPVPGSIQYFIFECFVP